jgi:hypothetical protein
MAPDDIQTTGITVFTQDSLRDPRNDEDSLDEVEKIAIPLPSTRSSRATCDRFQHQLGNPRYKIGRVDGPFDLIHDDFVHLKC